MSPIAVWMLAGWMSLNGQQAAYPLPPPTTGGQPATTPTPAADGAPAAEAPQPAASADVAQAPSAASDGNAPAPAGTQTPTTDAGTPAPASAPAAAPGGKSAPPAKGKKAPYTGPTEIIVLPPTPMLDQEGRQLLDPDAKPMFNPPVKQQRDKFGHPLFDDKGKPVFQTAKDLGYDEKGKKIPLVKEKPVKPTPVSISRGTFAVDGIVGKAALNYDIPDLKYIYEFVPGMGVAVISNMPFPGAIEQKGAFNGNLLTISVMDHTLEIASDKQLLGKKPESAFVLIDRDFSLPSRYPVVGWGTLRAAPYMWPGAKANAALTGTVPAPAVPVNLRPVALLPPCPVGQMRQAAGVTPGVTPPCVLIPKGTAGATGSTGVVKPQ